MEKKRALDFQKDVVPVVLKYMEGLKYGSVTLVVQDGKVIQIEKKEKIRL